MFASLHRRATRREWAAAVGILVAALSLGAAPAMAATDSTASPAASVGAGSISGVVSDGNGSGVPDADVSIITSDGVIAAEATTGPQGGYTVTDLSAGMYVVSVVAKGASAPVFWPDATVLGEAQTIEVAEAAAVTGIDVVTGALVAEVPSADDPSVAVPGEISLPSDGIPPSGSMLETPRTTDLAAVGTVEDANEGAAAAEPPSHDPPASSANESSHLDLDGGADHDTPTIQSLAEVRSFAVSGRISDEDGVGVSSARLSFRQINDPDPFYTSLITDADGRFSTRVREGTYTVQIAPGSGFAPIDETGVVVNGDMVLDRVVARTGVVSGIIANVGEKEGRVTLVRAEDLSAGRSAVTGGGGAFSVSQVPPGRYLVVVTRESDTADFAPTFFPGTTDVHQATVVVVESGGAVPDLGFIAASGHSISGVAPIPVGLHDPRAVAKKREPLLWNGQSVQPFWSTLYGAVTGVGVFRISGLPDGDYTVSAHAYGEWSYNYGYTYYEGFYDGSVIERSATPVPVDGADVGGIGITLVPFGYLIGTLVEMSGRPLAHAVLATAYRWSGTTWEAVDQRVVDWFSFRFDTAPAGELGRGVPAGTYVVEFSDPNTGDVYPYCVQFGNGRATFDGADRIEVTAEEAVASWGSLRSIEQGCPSAGTLWPDRLSPIDSIARVGQALTIGPGIWRPLDVVTFRYQWLADGAPIDGAIEARYVPTLADVGKRVSVAVTGSAPGYEDLTIVSGSTSPVIAGYVSVSEPFLIGDPQVGTVTQIEANWFPEGVNLTYQWFLDDEPIAGAIASTFTPLPSMAGKRLSVTILGTKQGWVSKQVTASSSTPIAPASSPSPSPSPSGTPSGSTTPSPVPIATGLPSGHESSPGDGGSGVRLSSTAEGVHATQTLPATGNGDVTGMSILGAFLAALGAATVLRRSRRSLESAGADR